jgi:hypothetical protein
MIRVADIYAVAVTVIATAGYFTYDSYLKSYEPPESWLLVKSLSIPDFVEGQNPTIIYDRTIRQPFTAAWSAEVHESNDKSDVPICTGSGINDYKPPQVPKPVDVTLSWFMGRECTLPAGQYLIEVKWDMQPKGYTFKKEQTYASNLFRVIPKDGTISKSEQDKVKILGIPE